MSQTQQAFWACRHHRHHPAALKSLTSTSSNGCVVSPCCRCYGPDACWEKSGLLKPPPRRPFASALPYSFHPQHNAHVCFLHVTTRPRSFRLQAHCINRKLLAPLISSQLRGPRRPLQFRTNIENRLVLKMDESIDRQTETLLAGDSQSRAVSVCS